MPRSEIYLSSFCFKNFSIRRLLYSNGNRDIFLVERAHALRIPYLRRAHDWIWLERMIVVASGFGTITVFAFIYPLTDLSTTDGKCRIGLPLKVSIPLLSLDIIINLALIGAFIYLLQPLLNFSGLSNTSPLWTNRLTSCIRCVLKTEERPDSVLCKPPRSLSFRLQDTAISTSLLWSAFCSRAIKVITVLQPNRNGS